MAAIGFLGGLACFSLARLQVRMHLPTPVRRADLLSSESDRVKEEEKQRRFLRKKFALRRSLLWLVPTLGFIAAFAVIRAICVIEWNPSEDVVRSVVLSGPIDHEGVFAAERESDKERAFTDIVATHMPHERGSAYLDITDGGTYKGSILVPLGFPWSTQVEALIENTHQFFRGGNSKTPLQVTIDENPIELIDTISTAERFQLGLTRVLFVVVHVMLLLCASLSYGYCFSRFEGVTNLLISPFLN